VLTFVATPLLACLPCRQQLAPQPRDAGLAVHDINSYMARFRPAGRATADKGHPEGPRVEPRVKPRHSAAQMDNSLRTVDIEGTRCVGVVQALVCLSKSSGAYVVTTWCLTPPDTSEAAETTAPYSASPSPWHPATDYVLLLLLQGCSC
jgi:hypothetical protein